MKKGTTKVYDGCYLGYPFGVSTLPQFDLNTCSNFCNRTKYFVAYSNVCTCRDIPGNIPVNESYCNVTCGSYNCGGSSITVKSYYLNTCKTVLNVTFTVYMDELWIF